jgi:dihydrofolate reductase
MINCIAAVSQNGAIGKKGSIPWNLPEDFKWFKDCTSGGVVLMGRKTYMSLPIRPLPNRDTWVLTHDKTFHDNNIRIFYSPEEVRLAFKEETKPIWICGGAEIYKEFLSDCKTLYLTRVNQIVSEADTFFPEFGIKFQDKEILKETPEFTIIKYGITNN